MSVSADWKKYGKQAPDGYRWVCMACGKTSRDVYGESPYNGGWDEACSLNARLLPESELNFDGSAVRSLKNSDFLRTCR